MKKNILVIAFGVAAMLMMSIPTQVSAQKLSSKEKSAIKKLAKKWENDGFRVTSLAFSMEEKIADFRMKIKSNPDLVELTSEGEGKSSFSAEMAAQNAAALQYATAAGSIIQGGIEREFGNIGEDYDKFHGSYIQDVAKYIMPLLHKEMTFSKKEAGIYYVKVGYTLSEERASEVREKAFDEALNEQQKTIKNGQDFGLKVRKYVKENVNPLKEE